MDKKKKKAEAKATETAFSGSEEVGLLKKQISELEAQIRNFKDIEENYRRNERLTGDILETVREGIIYSTLDGKVLYANSFFEKLIKLSKGDLIGRNILELAKSVLTGNNLSFALPMLKDLLQGKEIKPVEMNFNDSIIEINPNADLQTNRLSITVQDVTERRKSEKALQKSETRLRRAELASRSGNWELYLDTGKIIGSEGAMKLYGIENPVSDFGIIKRVPLPEYRQMLDKALKELIENDKPYNLEFRIRNASTGEIIDIHSICEYDRENRIIFGSIQDITDCKKAEEEIRKKNFSLAMLLEIAIDVLETVDRKKIMRTIAVGSTRLIDMETAAIYSIKGNDLYLEATTPALPADFPDEFRKARIDHHPHILEMIRTKTHIILNNAREASLTPEEKVIVDQRGLNSILYLPLITNKKIAGVLILGSVGRVHEFEEDEIDLCRTLSTLVSLSLENSELFESLTIEKNKAEVSDKLKTAFLHNISHEIRTPLNAIVGFSEFLNHPEITSKERKEYIDVIFQSNNQLLAIINDILNISQIETGLAVVHESPTSVNTILKNLHRQFLDELPKTGIEFRLNILHTGESDSILTDENKLIQILSNLLNNAFKFTNKGFIELGYSMKDNFAEFYVEDSGLGIPASEHTKIFERFYQVDKSVSRLYGGTGLGLSISKAYIEMLGGDISVDSTPGKGSKFTFRLPFIKADPIPASEILSPEPAKVSRTPVSTILIAEDEESNYALVLAMLKPHGYNILRAKNGRQAVDMCSTNPDIDLVLMDIKMPVLDGFEATRQILKIKPKIPIIAQTAYAHPSDRTHALETGCADYLAKPFDRHQLIAVISKYLK